MNVKKEVFEKCVGMIQKEISDTHNKLTLNRRTINNLAKEQRVLKASLGKLYEMLNGLK
jgi:hypothetical protein